MIALKNKKLTLKKICYLYIATRIITWFFYFGPFSDVVNSYYHYARIWSEGYTPYLEHLFEYPPANIITFYLPRIVDQATSLINYRQFYRLIMFIIDIVIFSSAVKTLKKLKLKKRIVYTALIYYIVATLKAKNFLYDSIDLIFISGLFFSLAILKLKTDIIKTRFLSWLFFWISTAFKYLTLPLALPFLLIRKNKKLFNEIKVSFIAFLAVWLVPLAIFKTSLSVTFTYHSQRGFQVESVPANIIRFINSFTKTETFVEVFKNYDIAGPVTDQLTPYLLKLFPLTIIIFVIYSLKRTLIDSKSLKDEYQEKIRLSLIFLILFLLSYKVSSTPSHLWFPPLLTIYPFKSVKKQLKVLGISFFIILISMSAVPNIKLPIFDLHTIIGVVRPFCLVYMLYHIIKT